MSEYQKTADLALSYQSIPRINEQFIVQPDSYVDLLLPDGINTRSRLRLHDINDRWIRATDLSAYEGYVPDDFAELNLPTGAYDAFDLDEEFFVGREHNPDGLPILANETVSRKHLGITLRLGECGLILALKDLSSHNGTEIVVNETLMPYVSSDTVTAA